jgi:hypothetical protein
LLHLIPQNFLVNSLQLFLIKLLTPIWSETYLHLAYQSPPSHHPPVNSIFFKINQPSSTN